MAITYQLFHPRLLLKRPWTIGLFVVLAALCAALADPKLFESLIPVLRKAPTVLSVTAAVMLESLLLTIIWLTLESRYAVAVQTHAAAVLFLVIVTVASVFGFWSRMALLGDSTGMTRNFGPRGYTFPEGIAALLALTGTGSIFIAAQNLIFLRKADYTPFVSARSQFLDDVRAMKDRFDTGQPSGEKDAAKLQQDCSNARTALNAPFSAEIGAYRRFVQKELLAPLDTLCALVAGADVQQAPETFLRACGLATPPNPWSSEDVSKMKTAFQKLGMPLR
jgi:hypothetical protein